MNDNRLKLRIEKEEGAKGRTKTDGLMDKLSDLNGFDSVDLIANPRHFLSLLTRIRRDLTPGDSTSFFSYWEAINDVYCKDIGLSVCNLCNGGVKFVRDNDRNRNIRYEALQSESGKMLLRRSGRNPDDISSVVLVEKERSYIKSEAVLKIMEYINLPFPQLALFLNLVPLFIRDFAYDNVANNRYNIFGRLVMLWKVDEALCSAFDCN
uniref:Uncharacterized protein n=1 Tax=Chenopodium quinoa TaxID=63459 RepID=A0A803LED0_CHEQI